MSLNKQVTQLSGTRGPLGRGVLVHRRWRPSITGLLWAVGPPAGGLMITLTSTVLNAFGPEVLAANWAGRTILFLLVFAGYGLVICTQLRYFNLLVFFGAGLALFIGVTMIVESVEERALNQRGEVTTCAVVDVATRIETHTGSDNYGTVSNYYYDYQLACADPRIQEMTTWNDPVAEKGDGIAVIHDPAGRLSTRPAAYVGDPRSSLRLGIACFVIAIVLRLLHELHVPPFRSPANGMDWPRSRRLRQVLPHWRRPTPRNHTGGLAY